MSKTREVVCIHYQCEHSCDLGKKAEFYGHCQTCPTYKARPGGIPARKDNRRQKIERDHRRDKDY